MASISITDRPELGSLDYGSMPDRKRPILTITHGVVSEVIAYFRDEQAEETFDAWMQMMLDAVGVTVLSEEYARSPVGAKCGPTRGGKGESVVG